MNKSPISSVADLTGQWIGLLTFNDRLMWDYLIDQTGVS